MGSGFELSLILKRITPLAEGIASFEFTAPGGEALPAFTAGSHLSFRLPGGLERQYSLCNDPAENHRYVVAVHEVPHSRGGSTAMHRLLRPGMRVETSAPRNNFVLDETASSFLFIAGGIGITPIRAMIARADRLNIPWRLVFCTRTPDLTAFLEEAQGAWATRCHLHHSGMDNSNPLDLNPWFARHQPGEHIYCCGPAGMMRAVESGTAHWPRPQIHFEWFSADPEANATLSKAAFEVELTSSGEIFAIPADRSILEVLLDAGIACDYSCEEGTCGTCATQVVAGEPDHRDSLIPSDPRLKEQGLMMICVSRARSHRLVLDL